MPVRCTRRHDGHPLGAFALGVLVDAARLPFANSAATHATVVSKGLTGDVLVVVASVAGHPGTLRVSGVSPRTPGLDELTLCTLTLRTVAAGIAPIGGAVLQLSTPSPRAQPLGAPASPQAPRVFVAGAVSVMIGGVGMLPAVPALGGVGLDMSLGLGRCRTDEPCRLADVVWAPELGCTTYVWVHVATSTATAGATCSTFTRWSSSSPRPHWPRASAPRWSRPLPWRGTRAPTWT